MKLIVGLGNPGRKYQRTRHNLGQRVIDQLAGQTTNSQWSTAKKLQASTVNCRPATIFAKPATFMNRSGVAVKKLLAYFKVELADLWVIHDDVDLPLGKIKIQVGRGAAGHHGVESIIKEIGSQDFVRFRLGIGRPEGNGEEERENEAIERFVLAKFTKKEKPVAEEMVKKAAQAVRLALEEGIEKAKEV